MANATTTKIELLYFDGCPSYERLLPHLRGLLDQAGVTARLDLRRVESAEEALRLRFLGSPSVRVDGRDVERAAQDRADYGLKCRLYRTSDGTTGMPPDDWILRAIGGPPLAFLAGRSLRHRLEGCPAPYREIHRGVLRCFVAGRIPNVDELGRLATELGVDLDQTLAELERRDVLALRGGDQPISVAYPFSATPTPHQVQLADTDAPLFAMCAIDALGVPFLARRRATARSLDPTTGERIEAWIEPDGRRRWEPPETVVIVAVSGDGPSATCCCPHIQFVATRERALALLAQSTEAEGRVLEMAEAIGFARRIFGDLLGQSLRTG